MIAHRKSADASNKSECSIRVATACALLALATAPAQVQGQCGGTPACPASAMPFGLPPATTEVAPPAIEFGTGGVLCFFPSAPVLAATATMQGGCSITIQETILFTSGPAIEIISGGALSPNGPHVVTGMFVCAGGSVCLPGLTESFMVTDRAIGTVVADTLGEHVFPGPAPDPSCPTCRGDMDGSGFVDAGDMAAFVAELISPTPDLCADLNDDGNINGLDIQPFVDRVLATPLGTSCSAIPLSAAGTATCLNCGNTFTLCVETINLITGVTTIECKSALGDQSFVIPVPKVPGVPPDSFTNGQISGTLVYTPNTVYQISGGVLTPIPLTTGTYVSHAPGGGGITVITDGGTDIIPLPAGSVVVTYAPCALPMPACGTPLPTVAFNIAPCPDIAAAAANWGPVPGIICQTGACCLPTGECLENKTLNCCTTVLGGTFKGVGTCCEPEACCFPNGTCQDLDPTCCTMLGGTPDGPGPCFPPEACCLPDGTCIMADPFCCALAPLNGIAQGAGTTCAPTGACCLADDSCIITTQACCEAPGVAGFYQGDGTTCVVEACCFNDGTCRDLDILCCVLAGGFPDGPGLCVAAEACCLPGGGCIDTDPFCCQNLLGGKPLGAGTTCAMMTGACCLPDDSCIVTTQACCEDPGVGGFYQGDGTACEVEACCFDDGTCRDLDIVCCVLAGGFPDGPGFCLPPEACCLPDGTCIMTDPACCFNVLGGTPLGAGSTCAPTGACCLPDGSCILTKRECCEAPGVDGFYLGDGTACDPPEECCFPDATCIETDPLCCVLAGGFPQGPGTTCTPTGACCLIGGVCVETTRVCCNQAGGLYLGDGTTCTPGRCGVPSGGDDCADAELITNQGTFPFDNSAATSVGPDHAACDFPGPTAIDNDIWFCWRATCDGPVRIETCGQTTVDTKLAVYDGCTCPPTDANLLACNDDDCGPDLQSGVNFLATSGQDYLIRLGTFPGAAGGTGTFSIHCALSNDNCGNAEAISGQGTFTFDNTAATTDGNPDPLCDFFGSQQIDRDVWFCWTSPCSGPVIVTTVGLTGVDTKIAVYDGCACPAFNILACNDDDPADGLQTTASFGALGGQTYLIRIGTFPGAAGGTGQFSIMCAGP